MSCLLQNHLHEEVKAVASHTHPITDIHASVCTSHRLSGSGWDKDIHGELTDYP